MLTNMASSYGGDSTKIFAARYRVRARICACPTRLCICCRFGRAGCHFGTEPGLRRVAAVQSWPNHSAARLAGPSSIGPHPLFILHRWRGLCELCIAWYLRLQRRLPIHRLVACRAAIGRAFCRWQRVASRSSGSGIIASRS